ncbi:QCR9 [Sanghuangporus sanghuang]
MAISTTLYNTLFKRNSVFVSSVFVGAFAFSIGFDVGINAFWDRWNQGDIQKQWKDVKHIYVKNEEE